MNVLPTPHDTAAPLTTEKSEPYPRELRGRGTVGSGCLILLLRHLGRVVLRERGMDFTEEMTRDGKPNPDAIFFATTKGAKWAGQRCSFQRHNQINSAPEIEYFDYKQKFPHGTNNRTMQLKFTSTGRNPPYPSILTRQNTRAKH